MTSFAYLDLAIGLSFIYLLLALVCSTLNESIAGVINSRGKTLAKGISSLLQDPALEKSFFEHPLIQGISGGKGSQLPSYISSNKFSLVLMDILTGPNAPASDAGALRVGIKDLKSARAQAALTAVLDNPKMKNDQQKLELWYEQGMDRVSGWYKRTAQVRIFVLAALVTVALNADSLKMLHEMWNNPTLSAVLVEDAKDRLQKGRPDEDLPLVTYDNPDDPTASTPRTLPERDVISGPEMQLLGQVVGWHGDSLQAWRAAGRDRSFWGWIGFLITDRLGGWIITILAISLGAPFWFDMLNKFMNVRNAGQRPEKEAEKQIPEKRVEAQVEVKP